MTRPILALSAFCLASAALAAPIPIAGPTTISQSGDYVVTADIDALFQPAIKLSGEVDAVVDLGGHTITAYGAPVVQVRARNDGSACRALTLRNGRVTGGYGLSAMVGSIAGCPSQVTLSFMTFESADVYVERSGLAIFSSQFVGGGIFAVEAPGVPPVRLRGNRLFGGDITLLGATNASLQGNSLRGGSLVIRGVPDQEAAHVLVASNMIGGNLEIGGGNAGDGASDLYVARNRINGYVTITQTVAADLQQNQIAGCGPGGTSVGVAFGTAGWIDGNAFQGGCEHGIVFDELSSGNEYSANTFRIPVEEPVLDYGTGNVCGNTPDVLE
jgi:hypothetical protein